MATGFSNISRGAATVAGGGAGVGSVSGGVGGGGYSAEVLKQQMLGHGGEGGGRALLASCFPAMENVPDDKYVGGGGYICVCIVLLVVRLLYIDWTWNGYTHHYISPTTYISSCVDASVCVQTHLQQGTGGAGSLRDRQCLLARGNNGAGTGVVVRLSLVGVEGCRASGDW